MVLGPDPWSLTLGPRQWPTPWPPLDPNAVAVGYKLRAVPGGSSSSESGAARSLARNGLVLGAKKSQQFAPFQFLLVDFCWWLTFELFPVYIYIYMFFQILGIFSNLGGALSQSVTLNNYPADNVGRAKGAKIWHCHARDDGGKHPNLQLLFRVQLTVRSL